MAIGFILARLVVIVVKVTKLRVGLVHADWDFAVRVCIAVVHNRAVIVFGRHVVWLSHQSILREHVTVRVKPDKESETYHESNADEKGGAEGPSNTFLVLAVLVIALPSFFLVLPAHFCLRIII